MRRIYFPLFHSKVLLYVSFLSGLLIAYPAVLCFGETLYSAMRMFVSFHVSIIGLLCSLLIPLFISAFAVYSNESWIITTLAFLKAFSFGCCSIVITSAFRSSGFLAHYLVLFSDIHLLCILWWFWLRHYPCNHKSLCLSTTISCTAAVFVCILDSLLISPFWVSLQQ